MDTPQLQKRFASLRAAHQSVSTQLQDVARLDQDRTANLVPLRRRLAKLEALLPQLRQASDHAEELARWLNDYGQQMAQAEQLHFRHFASQLEPSLQALGLPLSGQFPNLRAGLFSLEVDLDKNQAVLWYGPQQERLDQCRLSASEVANRLRGMLENLGSRLPEEELLKRLRDAYLRVAGASGGPAPLTSVLPELAHLLQGPKFRKDPRREYYQQYTRADFSYDLFRLRHALPSHGFRLSVAIRAHTRRAQDSLWIPENPSGAGSHYSRLQFEEVHR